MSVGIAVGNQVVHATRGGATKVPAHEAGELQGRFESTDSIRCIIDEPGINREVPAQTFLNELFSKTM